MGDRGWEARGVRTANGAEDGLRTDMRTYAITTLAELLLSSRVHVTEAPLRPTPDMVVPPLSFGDVELERPGYNLLGSGAMPHGLRTPLPPLAVFHLRDAVVWGSPGLVTVGPYAVRETIQHLVASTIGAEMAHDEIRIPRRPPDLRLHEANHLLAGNSANYYHFLIDIVPRLQTPPIAELLDRRPTLIPVVEQSFQREFLDLLAPAGHPFVPIDLTTCVAVERLAFVPNLSGFGFAPQPVMTRVFDYLNGVVPTGNAPARDTPQRIYVGRADSPNRRLVNEAEVARIVEDAGFATLNLDGMAVADQIRCFRAATHVVAPHGAGLANIMFAAARPALLELQMDEYVNWCFRRLSGLRGGLYGCLVGESRRETGWAHSNTWTVSTERLRAVLDSPAFLST